MENEQPEVLSVEVTEVIENCWSARPSSKRRDRLEAKVAALEHFATSSSSAGKADALVDAHQRLFEAQVGYVRRTREGFEQLR